MTNRKQNSNKRNFSATINYSIYDSASLNSLKIDFSRIDQLNDSIIFKCFDFLTQKDLIYIQLCNIKLRECVQSYAKIKNLLKIYAGSLKVQAFNKLEFPSERTDLWLFNEIPPEDLPQSLLHGRSSALLALVTPSSDLEVSQGHSLKEGENDSLKKNSSKSHETDYLEDSFSLYERLNQINTDSINLLKKAEYEGRIKNGISISKKKYTSFDTIFAEFLENDNENDLKDLNQSTSHSLYLSTQIQPLHNQLNHTSSNLSSLHSSHFKSNESQNMNDLFNNFDNSFNKIYQVSHNIYDTSNNMYNTSNNSYDIPTTLPQSIDTLIASPNKPNTKVLRIAFEEFLSLHPYKKNNTKNPVIEQFSSSDGQTVSVKFGCFDENIGNKDNLWVCGGYGLFELWDSNIPLHCNEIWEYSPTENVWTHPFIMTESSLEDDAHLRWEDRDAVIIGEDDQRCLILFGDWSYKNMNHRNFKKISFSKLPINKYQNKLATYPFSIDQFFENNRSIKSLIAIGDIPDTREYFATVLWTPKNQKNSYYWIIMFGGLTPELRLLNELYLLCIPSEYVELVKLNDLDRKLDTEIEWKRLSTKKNDKEKVASDISPCKRFGHSMTQIGNKIYLFGGKTDNSNSSKTARKWFSAMNSSGLLQDMWILTYTGSYETNSLPNSCDWIWKEIECYGYVPTPRMAHRTISIGLHLFLFGGFTGRYVNDMYSLNTGNLCWNKVDLSRIITTITPFKSTNEIISPSKSIITFGNLDESFSSQNSDSSKNNQLNEKKIPIFSKNLNRYKTTIDKYSFSSNHFTRKRFPITSNLPKKHANESSDLTPLTPTKLESLSYDCDIENSRFMMNDYLKYDEDMYNNFDDCFVDYELYIDLSSSSSTFNSTNNDLQNICYNNNNNSVNSTNKVVNSPMSNKSDGVYKSGYPKTRKESPQSSSSPNCKKNSSKSKNFSYLPICGRMEATLLYDGNSHLYIFGGSKRYNWDCTLFRFQDFCKDCYILKLST